MKPEKQTNSYGLIVTKLGKVGVSLHGFGIELRSSDTSQRTYQVSRNVEEAILKSLHGFGFLDNPTNSIEWICGSCITKKLAGRLNAVLRKRAPGGGRKRGRKGLKSITPRLSKPGLDDLKTLSKITKEPYGIVIERLVSEELRRLGL